MAFKYTIKMATSKKTPGAHRFSELDSSGNFIADLKKCKVGQIYMRQSDIGEEAPEKPITVTVCYPAVKPRSISKNEYVVRMAHKRPTPQAHLFAEVDDEGNIITDLKKCKVGQIYMRQSDIGEEAPDGQIEVTVTF